MAKKQPKTVINNIDFVNIEINYDKLAEAIVKANEEVENKKQKSSKVLTSSMAMLLSLLFAILGVVIGFFTVAVIYSYILLFPTINQITLGRGKIVSLHILICLLILAMSVTVIIMMVSAVEIYREKDRNFIMGAFSGVVGFAALVVALITLLNGVI